MSNTEKKKNPKTKQTEIGEELGYIQGGLSSVLSKDGILQIVRRKGTFKEPLLFIVRATGKVEIKEGQGVGLVKIMRSDGNMGMITLSPQKLLSFRWGDDMFKAWIIYENAATPLPEMVIHDSKELYDNYKGLQVNYQASEQTLTRGKELPNIVLYLGIGIAAILFVTFMWGGEFLATVFG